MTSKTRNRENAVIEIIKTEDKKKMTEPKMEKYRTLCCQMQTEQWLNSLIGDQNKNKKEVQSSLETQRALMYALDK